LQLKLDILKHIIKAKLEEKKLAEESAANAERKRRVMEALAKKQESSLLDMSEDDLRAELAKL
jgi:hypothetical protein